MRCSTNVYLTALAVADIIFLLFVMYLSIKTYPMSHGRSFEFFQRTMGLAHWICDAAAYTSIYLTVSFTVERYIAVCHPIRGQVLCTEERAKKVIGGMLGRNNINIFVQMIYILQSFLHYVSSQPFQQHLNIKFHVTSNTLSPQQAIFVNHYQIIQF